MISSRSDYDFVTIDNGLIVNGDVMPVRTAQNRLRAEDIAFCSEAAWERRIVAAMPNMGILPSESVDKYIIGSRWRNCIASNLEVAEMALKPSVAFSAKKVYDSSRDIGAIPDLMSYYPECAFDTSILKGDQTEFNAGSHLKKQPILDVFDDLKNLTMLRQDNVYARSDNSTYSRSEFIDKFFGVEHLTSAGGVILYSSMYYKQRDYTSSAQPWPLKLAQSVSQATPGYWYVDIGSNAAKYVSRAWIVFLVRQYKEVRNSSTTTDNYKYYTFWEEASEVTSAGIVKIPYNSLWSHVNACVTTFGGGIPGINDVENPVSTSSKLHLIDFLLSVYPTRTIVRLQLGDHTKWWS